MFNKITIQMDERGLLFKNGSYVKVLQAGTYRLFPFSNETIVTLNIMKPFAVKDKDLALFLHDEKLLSELDVILVQDHEICCNTKKGALLLC